METTAIVLLMFFITGYLVVKLDLDRQSERIRKLEEEIDILRKASGKEDL